MDTPLNPISVLLFSFLKYSYFCWSYDTLIHKGRYVPNQQKCECLRSAVVSIKFVCNLLPNEQRFIFFLSETENASLIVLNKSQIFTNRYLKVSQFRAYDRFLCSESLHGIVRNQERVSQGYETSVSKKRLHTKRTTLHFVVKRSVIWKDMKCDVCKKQTPTLAI